MVNNIKKTAVIFVALMLCFSFLPIFTNTVEAQTGTQPPTLIYPSSNTLSDFKTFESFSSASINTTTGEANLTSTSVAQEGYIRFPIPSPQRPEDLPGFNLLKNNYEFIYTIKTGSYSDSILYDDWGGAFAFYNDADGSWRQGGDHDYETLGIYAETRYSWNEANTPLPQSIAVEFDNIRVTGYGGSTTPEKNIDALTTGSDYISHIAITEPIRTTDDIKLQHYGVSYFPSTVHFANNSTNTVRISWKLIDAGLTTGVEDNTYRISYQYFLNRSDVAAAPNFSNYKDYSYSELTTRVGDPTQMRAGLFASTAAISGKNQVVKMVATYDYTVNYCIADKNGNLITRGTQTCVPVPGLSPKTGKLPTGTFDTGAFPAAPTGFMLKPGQTSEKMITTTAANNVYNIAYIDTVNPTVQPINGLTVNEDAAISPIAVTASDNVSTGTYLKVQATGLPAGLSYANGSISGTPTTPGSYTVNITVTDEALNTATTSFNIVVNDITPPSILTESPINLETGTAANVLIQATDNSGAAVSLSVSQLPAGLSYSQGKITGTPTTPTASFTFTITAKDPSGNTATKDIELIIADKTAPVITGPTTASALTGNAISPITITATDNSGVAPTLSAGTLPEGLSFDPATGIISGTPVNIGEKSIIITATDGAGNSSTHTIALSITDGTPPVLAIPTVAAMDEEVAISPITVTATDNSGEVPTISFSALPAGLSANAGVITGTPTMPGTYKITVTAKDAAGNQTTGTLNLMVLDKTAPVITAPATASGSTGTAITAITITVTDEFDRNPFLTVTGLPQGLVYSAGSISGTTNLPGSFNVLVSAEDSSGNKSEKTISLTIADATAPVISAPITVAADTATPITSFTVSATDNSGNPPSFTASGLPAGLSFDTATKTFSGTITEPGSHTVTITASDGSNQSTQDIVFTVADKTGPAITSSVTTVNAVTGTAITAITVSATDNSGATPTVTLTNLPAGLSFNSSTNEISGTPVIPSNGTPFEATITAEDGSGNISTQTISFTIADGTKPVIVASDTITASTGIALRPIAITVSDNSGGSVTVIVDPLPGGITYDTASRTIIGTPTTPVSGFEATITAIDPSGNVSTKSMIFNISDRTGPVFEALTSPFTTDTETTIALVIRATDNSGDAPTISSSSLPTGLSLTHTDIDGVMTYRIEGRSLTPYPNGYLVTLYARDSATTPNMTTFELKLFINDATSPVLVLPSTGSGQSGTAIIPIRVTASDNSGVAPTITATNLPQGLIFDGTQISGTPASPVSGFATTFAAADEAGNVSSKTITFTITDGTVPLAPVIDPIKAGATVVTGSTQAGTSVTVYWTEDKSNSTAATVTDTTWSVAVPVGVSLADGNKVWAEAIIVKTSPLAEMTVDGLVPADPVINMIKAGETAVSGTGEPGATITITHNGSTYTTVVDPSTGKWTLGGFTFADGEVIEAFATDAAGNSSGTVSTTVDRQAPLEPVIYYAFPGDPIITGEAEPNAFVTLVIGTGEPITVQADGTGNWMMDIGPSGQSFVDGETIFFTASDAAGNQSPQLAYVVDATAPPAPTINGISTDSTVISGTAEPNSFVDLYLPYGSLLDVNGDPITPSYWIEVDASGNWSIDLSAEPVLPTLTAGEIVYAYAIDAAYNLSPTSSSIIALAGNPVAPSIDPIIEADTQITGRGTPGAAITVVFHDGSTLSATVGVDGSWTAINVPLDILHAGDLVAAYQTIAGQNSPYASTTVYGTDITPPAAPVFNVVKTTDTSVGGTAEPGTWVIVFWPDSTTSDVITDPMGNWSAEIPATVTISDGTVIKAISLDDFGNESPEASTTVDRIAPNIDHIDNMTLKKGAAITNITVSATDASNDVSFVVTGLPSGLTYSNGLISGSPIPASDGDFVVTITATDPSGNESTDTFTITVDGTAPVIDPISSQSVPEFVKITATTVTVDSTAVSVTVGTLPTGISYDAATRTFSGTPTVVGNYNISITAEDAVGNQSVAYFDLSVTEDLTAPLPPTFVGVRETSKEFTGTGEPGSTVNITRDGVLIATALVGENGNWSVLVPETAALTEGDVLIISQTDQAGNTSPSIRSTVSSGDASIPLAPLINPVAPSDLMITGRSAAGNTVSLTLPDGQVLTTISDLSNGNWSITLPAGITLNAGDILSATQTNTNEITGPAVTTTVTGNDLTAPASPVVAPIKAGTDTISGTAEPGSTVTVTWPDGSTDKIIAKPDGTWSVETPTTPLEDGQKVSVTAKDAAGNTSTPTVGVVDGTPPVMELVTDKLVNKTVPVSILLSNEAGLSYSISGLPAGLALDGNSILGTAIGVDGIYNVQVNASDAAGNISTLNFKITVDGTAPVISYNDPGSPYEYTQLPVVTITVDDSSATLSVNPTSIGTVSFNSTNRTIRGKLAASGTLSFEITATDPAGNTASKTLVITVLDDTTPPEAPAVKGVNENSTSISGYGEPNTAVEVIITLPGGGTLTGTVLPDGSFSVDLGSIVLEPGAIITVVLVDEAGNTSPAVTTTVADSEQMTPVAPLIYPVYAGDTTITGSGTTGNTVEVTLANGDVITTLIQEGGSWSLTLPSTASINPGDVIKATQANASGKSPAATTTVFGADSSKPYPPVIDAIPANPGFITGTGEPGSTITVTWPTDPATTSTATVNPDGSWSIDASGQTLPNGSTVTAIATDKAGNDSDPSSMTVDAVLPVVTQISSFAIKLGDPLPSNLLVEVDEETSDIIVTGLPVGVAYNPATGLISGMPAYEGEYKVSITAVDKAGNHSIPMEFTITADGTAPALQPVADETVEQYHMVATISIVLDNYQDTVTVSSLPNALSLDKSAEPFVITGIANVLGVHPVTITVEDSVGNKKTINFTITVVPDTSAPNAPVIYPLATGATDVTGKGEAYTDVHVSVNGAAPVVVQVAADGTWTLPVSPALVGGELITATNVDRSGNVSPKSTMTVSTVPGELLAPYMEYATEGDGNVTGLLFSDSSTAEDRTLYLERGDGSILTGTTTILDGTWSITIPAEKPLVAGELLKVYQSDGTLKSPYATTVVYGKDDLAPATPSVDPIYTDSTSISGKCEPGSTISVAFSDGVTKTAIVGFDGNWQLPVPAGTTLVAGEFVTVSAKDDAGNSSPSLVVKINGIGTPTTPVVEDILPGQTIIGGTGDYGSTVTVELPGGGTATGTVNPDGSWEVTVPPGVVLKPGDTVVISQTNPNKGTSPDLIVKIEQVGNNLYLPIMYK